MTLRGLAMFIVLLALQFCQHNITFIQLSTILGSPQQMAWVIIIIYLPIYVWEKPSRKTHVDIIILKFIPQYSGFARGS